MSRKVDWFRIGVMAALAALVIAVSMILGKSWVGLALGADMTYVRVTVPAKLYWADGTALVPKTDYKYMVISYGPCSGDAEIMTRILGGTNIWPPQVDGVINYVPVGQVFCAVATVIGPDNSPIGKSNTAVFSTVGTKPGAPLNLRF
jgi:hypothetical protein